METSLQDPELPEALLASKEDSALAGVCFHWCAPEEVREPYRGLLVHKSDMTSALERFHGGEIALEVLNARRGEGPYFREVILRRAATGAPVEYGLIEIELGEFPAPLREAILEGGQPLGGILNASGMRYRSAPVGFFHVPGASLEGIFSSSSGGGDLYGRYNQLFSETGALLARIIEILPTTTAP